jgi:Domain of unknown function (DUF1995)
MLNKQAALKTSHLSMHYANTGLAQRYEVAEPLVRSFLRKLERDAYGGVVSRIKTQLLVPEDYTALLLAEAPEKAKDQACLLFLTGEKVLEQQVTDFLKEMGPRLVVFTNPTWQKSSDFGFFAKRKAEALLSNFLETYSLTKFSCKGEAVAVLKCWPAPWQVFKQQGAAGAVTRYTQIAVFDRAEKPSYRDCENALIAHDAAAATAAAQQ